MTIIAIANARRASRASGQARIAGYALDLRRHERAVLEARAGPVVPRELLIGEVFGFDEPVGGNAIEAHVTRLRGKPAPDGCEIRTVCASGTCCSMAADPRTSALRTWLLFAIMGPLLLLAAVVLGNRTPVFEILSNLIDNGVRYNRRGGSVSVRLVTGKARDR